MTEAEAMQRALESLLNDESLIADLKDDEAKALIDWSLSELRRGAEHESLGEREKRIREAMREIDDLVGHRQTLVADDLEERMIRLLVGDLDPKSQVRLGIEREIAQVTAEKDHISSVELVRRLSEVTTKTWRLKAQGNLAMPSSSAENPGRAAAQAEEPASGRISRVRPVPRPTPIPPKKPGVLERLFGRK